MSEYLTFEETPNSGRKTKRWVVLSKRSGDLLGTIRWFGRWRQYTFWPEPGTTFNTGCMEDVSIFIHARMRERREGGLSGGG